MGVDFMPCDYCGECFPDCGDFFECRKCSSRFCDDKCGGRIEKEELDEYGDQLTSCVVCRKEIVPDDDLLKFLLKKSGITYEAAKAMYREESDKDHAN